MKKSKKCLFYIKLLFFVSFFMTLFFCATLTAMANSNNQGVGTIYIESDSPLDNGRLWVESSPDKTNKASCSITLYNADGVLVFKDEASKIKGRGNSTWYGAKKPYQVKLSEKIDILSTGNNSNKSKTWILLANNYDHSNMRNILAFDLAAAIGMKNPIEYIMVNLYYDGEYRGLYMLCEKVSIESGRVDIFNLVFCNI